ncbi:MAG: fused response regulator/phosphatase, partial [Solirubrobacterales bacterium]|nr:fused response regulator/phosphatase [Solirubrobacterales bacterium]
MYDVVLVEDDATYARLVEIALSGEARVTVARSVADAQGKIEAVRADVVLTDLHLPDGQGGEVVETLVAAHPTTAVVALSGIDGPTTDAALAAGATSFVLKGGEMDGQMLAAIAVAAQRTRALREAEAAGEVAPGARGRPHRSGIRAGP